MDEVYCNSEILPCVWQIMTSEEYGPDALHTPHDLASWEIVEIRGIPNLGPSDDSWVWVIEWLEMDDAFQSIVIGLLKDDHVQVRTAISLLTTPFSQLKKLLEGRESVRWTEMVP